jgi:hypothetical protein
MYFNVIDRSYNCYGVDSPNLDFFLSTFITIILNKIIFQRKHKKSLYVIYPYLTSVSLPPLCILKIRLIHTGYKIYQIKLKQSTTIVPTLRIKYACCMYWKNLRRRITF